MNTQNGIFGAVQISSIASVVLLHAAFAAPEIVSRDPELGTLVPAEAYEHVGCWEFGDKLVATGYSSSVDSLPPGKARETETEFAEVDAKGRIVSEVARAQEPGFDAETHTVSAEISGFQVAATYKLPDRDGFFLVGIVKRDAVHVRTVFDLKRARGNALAAFEAGDYVRAARLFAALTQHGAEDRDTAAFASASSAHVNLAAGVTGSARTEALRRVADFHFQRGDDEKALDFSYQLYREDPLPERPLLERLAELSQRTHHLNNATAFRKEIASRWPNFSKP